MRNIKLTLEYDGTKFFGWQYQPDARTVQGEIERSLKQLLQEEVSLIGSGRTDAGVHAFAQVANFHTANPLDTQKIRSGLNALLPHDVVVHEVEEVEADFHARYSAKAREYRYVISKVMRAVGRQYSWFFPEALDVTLMQRASQVLVGEHDFSSFCQTDFEGNHYLCTLERIQWTEFKDEIVLEVVANRFLHNMVRIIVGTMIDVGRGKVPSGQVQTIRDARDRRTAGRTVPAHGLFLVRVIY